MRPLRDIPFRPVELSEWHMWWKQRGHRELYRLLLTWWDPIDVKDVPEAQNEYAGYSGTLGRMLREGASEAELANYLGEAEAHMGLRPNDELDRLAANKLVEWYGDEMQRA
jgi:hypothetical protein